jgi:outer membrane protein
MRMNTALKQNTQLLMLEMEKEWKDLTDAYRQVALCQESRMQAKENMKVNRDSYDNGLVGISDLLEARAILQEAGDNLAEARANYLVKRSRYLRVTNREF